MLLVITSILVGAFLVGKYWSWIVDFLNGPVRDLVEKCLGVEKSVWYVDFVIWLDGKACPVISRIEDVWRRFNQRVLKVRARYARCADGGFAKTTETVVAVDDKRARRVVTEEYVAYEDLPDPVRHEMIRKATQNADLDVKEVVRQKMNDRVGREVAPAMVS